MTSLITSLDVDAYVLFPASSENAMEIFVDLGTNTISLKVKKWYTIKNVKNMIESLVGIPTEKQLLLYLNKKMVEDEAALAELRIGEGQTLNMVKSVRVYVKALTGKTFEFDLNSNLTLEGLKESILKREGIPVDQQRLIYHGKRLEDLVTLADYDGLSEGVIVIHLITRLHG